MSVTGRGGSIARSLSTVAPAKAGAHNHREKFDAPTANSKSSPNRALGVWVPAPCAIAHSAGTTPIVRHLTS